ncbi:MAG: hypothetical protein D3911_16230 [Candidatus Electrothrix sp. AW3_4]|nr:hypothetical protein [Candidatus Electrothrix gigas]
MKKKIKLIAWNKKFYLLAFLILHSVYLQPVYSAVYHNEPVPNKLSQAAPDALWTVPVVVIRFIPRSGDGELLDPVKAPDYYHLGKTPYSEKKIELDRGLKVTHFYRQEGTRYRAYRNPDAVPSITYPVFAVYTVEDIPPASNKFYNTNKRGEKVPFPDWFKIMRKINGKRWVEKKVSENSGSGAHIMKESNRVMILL